jgi:hypothetical protein
MHFFLRFERTKIVYFFFESFFLLVLHITFDIKQSENKGWVLESFKIEGFLNKLGIMILCWR